MHQWGFTIFVNACFYFINCVVSGVVLTLMIDIEDLTLSAHVLLNLLNQLGKSDKCKACRAFYHFLAASLLNSIIQDYDC